MNTNEMEIACTCNARAEVKAKGTIAKLPKVKKAIIGRADINSYGKGSDRGKMVGGKYQILVILAEDFEGIKAGTPTTANAVLYKMGVKTMPFFTDFEKAKAACKKAPLPAAGSSIRICASRLSMRSSCSFGMAESFR